MYIVAYDIAENRERQLVARSLTNYGERIQKSVWRCDIGAQEYRSMCACLKRLKIETGYIDIWHTNGTELRLGACDTAPKRPWAHCL